MWHTEEKPDTWVISGGRGINVSEIEFYHYTGKSITLNFKSGTVIELPESYATDVYLAIRRIIAQGK